MRGQAGWNDHSARTGGALSDTEGDEAPPGWQNDLYEVLRANDVPDAVQREAVQR